MWDGCNVWVLTVAFFCVVLGVAAFIIAPCNKDLCKNIKNKISVSWLIGVGFGCLILSSFLAAFACPIK